MSTGNHRYTSAAALLAFAAAAVAWAAAASAADTTAPALINFQPPDGAFVGAESAAGAGQAYVGFAFVVQDSETAVDLSNVSVLVWSESQQRYLALDSFSAGEYGTDRTALALGSLTVPEGPYRFEVKAADALGNTLFVNSSFNVDVTPPTLEVAAATVSTDGQLTVRIDARDAGSGIVIPVVLSYQNACSYNPSTQEFEIVALPGRIVGEASFELCVGSSNRFSVTVSDLAGNRVTVEQRDVVYDAGGPTFSEFSPSPFSRLDGPRATVVVSVDDDASGVDAGRVQVSLSQDGGLTWGNWTNATVTAAGGTWRATYSANLRAGAFVAVRWRAWDIAGNGPAEADTRYFYMNGEPFVVTYEPAEGSVVTQFTAVRLNATFADPDADHVTATFRSDIDGPLGAADGRRVQLSLGIHNLTISANDGHGHIVNYTYQVQVVVRPPPDPRPLLFTGILTGLMFWVAYAAWTKEEDLPEASLPKA